MNRRLATVVALALSTSGCGASHAAIARVVSSVATERPSGAATTQEPAHAARSLTLSSFTTPVSSKAAATKRAIALTEAVTLPAGAASLSHSPSSLLDGDGTAEFPGPYLVQVARWWSVSGRLASVTAALVAHPPSGFIVCSGGCPATEGSATDLSFWPRDDDSGTTNIGVTLLQGLGHVDVRVVGDSIWNPERSSRERVPTSVQSVELSLRSSGSLPPGQPSRPVTPRSGTVIGAGAAQLAALLNHLPTPQVQPAPAGCYDGGTRVTARFRFSGNTLVFSWTDGSCGWIYPTYNGVPQPIIAGHPLPLVEQLLRTH